MNFGGIKMNNVNIDGIKDMNVVRDLFSSVNGLGKDNCFLVVLNRDYVPASIDPSSTFEASATITGAKAGGVAGGLVGGAIAGSMNSAINEAVNEFYSKLTEKQRILFSRNVYCGYLVNITDKGLGVIPLRNSGQLIPKIKDFITDIDNYVFIGNEEIARINIEKLPLHFSTKKLAIYFKNLENVSTQWTLPTKNKLVSYQEENCGKLASKLS
jgi:hypothetical protein